MLPPFDYKMFYEKYQVDYWGFKIQILKNIIDDFQNLKSSILSNITDINDSDAILTIKTDLHFTYFQMIESLFELIFAIEYFDEENIWHYISFSKLDNYNKIKELAEGNTELFDKTVPLRRTSDKKKINLPFIEYVFYFGPLLENEQVRKQNIENIKELLVIFAEDFSDRNEYNAFKHALRLLYCNPGVKIESNDKSKSIEFQSPEGFIYLDKIKNEEGEVLLRRVTKSFSIEKDYLLGIACCQLISNIIRTRKARYFKTKEHIYLFNDFDFKKPYKNIGEFQKLEETFQIVKKK